MTCIANDFGWANVFKRQIEAHASIIVEGDEHAICNDVLLVFSTSGNSGNIIEALECANELGMATIGLLGNCGGDAAPLCDYSIIVDAGDSATIQDGHQVILHVLCEIVESWILEETSEVLEEQA